MRNSLEQFVTRGQELAAETGLSWDFEYGVDGKVIKSRQWNLSALRGSSARPIVRLSSVATYAPALSVLQKLGRHDLANGGAARAMPSPWVELFKSLVLHDQLVKRNKPANATCNLGHAFRILATCADGRSPEDLSADDVRLAFNVALHTGASGKRGGTLKALISQWFDTYGLSSCCPLSSYCVPFSDDETVRQHRRLENLATRQVDYTRPMQLRAELSQRHAADRLPDERSFWELVRIVFTEKPRTISDALRFCQYRLLIVTGLRIGELVTLPADALRRTEHLVASHAGVGAKESWALRHFAEKQGDDEGAEGVVLREAVQHIPEVFREVIISTVAEALRLTTPMRITLKAQREAGRLLPDLAPSELVADWEIYGRLSGMIQTSGKAPSRLLHEEYRSSHDPSLLERIRVEQAVFRARHGLSRHIREYFRRAEVRLGRPLRRHRDGRLDEPLRGQPFWLLVSDIDEYAMKHIQSKLADWTPSVTSAGATVQPEDYLFLYPARARAEDAHDAIIDTGRYFGVARAATADANIQLGRGRLFDRYSDPADGPYEGLDPHSLRHLQNTELFRHGVSDAIITKRFNRRSPVQSHAYDHRSLHEHLQAMEVPGGTLAPKAAQAFALIGQDRIRGPIVSEFKEIQAREGDEAAFAYLNAEVGALHVTPYGFCVNSFAVNPCPKHLECFNGCGHLVRTADPAEQSNLEAVRDRLKGFIDQAGDNPSQGPKFEIQIRHARQRYDAVVASISTQPGAAVFEGGESHHVPIDATNGRLG